MITLILSLLGTLQIVRAQQEASLTQPPLIETNTLTLDFSNQHHIASINEINTTVSFMQHYTSEPMVYLSLVTLDDLKPLSVSTFTQSVGGIKTSRFYHCASVGMTLGGNDYLISRVKVMYLAYEYKSYSFIQLYEVQVTPAINENQYLKMNYLAGSPSALSSTHSYSLNAILSGYQGMTLSGTPDLYIDTVFDDDDSYLLNIRYEHLTVLQLRILRILIDRTEMNSRITGPSDLSCSVGTIVHRSDPNIIQSNGNPDYLPFAMFYGIKGWEGLRFDLPALTYIFNNSNPRVQVNIGYILFQTKSCPANQGYVMSESLCYGLSAAFYYQLTPATMAPCPYSCYACVGPLSTQCKSCVEGWNRILSFGRCLCITGFYDPGGPICKNCTEAIQGCYTCSSATNCLTCLTGCNAIGFSPIYCDCPGHVQPDYPYSCPETFYYEHDSSQCLCKPQTYLDAQFNKCYPCDLGCYICVGSSSHCLVCLDSYILVENHCVFYYNSYVLLGQTSSYNSPEARCLRWDSSNTVCLRTCSKYYYQFNCYGSCPLGTFPLQFPWKTCQPCKIICDYCYNFTVCYQCKQNYFYFNKSTFACDHCSQHCLTCVNSSYCSKCETNYLLQEHSCVEQAVADGPCPANCSLCLVGDQCLLCQTGLYLNRTTYVCMPCQASPGFQIDDSGECVEVCGDGIVVYAVCDDGNNVGGDGCSKNCQIEAGFDCFTYFSKSYCWNIATAVQWQLYNSFGKNQFILEVTSPADLSSLLTELSCTFNWTLEGSKATRSDLTYWINYHMPTVLPMDTTNPQTSTHITGVKTTNRCYLVINRISNYTVVVNTVPESLFIDYEAQAEKICQSDSLKTAIEIMLYTVLGSTMIGLVPSSGFATLRVSLLMMCSYLDYYQMPINSFSIYQAQQSITFIPPSTSTKELVTFSDTYYFSILWRLACLYGAIFFLHELASRYVIKFVESMEWSFVLKFCKHLRSRKNLAYQAIYTSYQAVVLTYILIILQNFSEASVATIFFASLHMLVAILTKVHFVYTLKELEQANKQLHHSMMTDQLQNIGLAVMVLFASADISYTPLILALFGGYTLASLLYSDSKFAGDFKISEYLAVWQYGICVLLLIVTQLMKFANMWRDTSQDYEQFSIELGLAIEIVSGLAICVGFVITVIAIPIRVCEIRLEGQKEEVATAENTSQNSYNQQ